VNSKINFFKIQTKEKVKGIREAKKRENFEIKKLKPKKKIKQSKE
jgi:hypothetical protein